MPKFMIAFSRITPTLFISLLSFAFRDSFLSLFGRGFGSRFRSGFLSRLCNRLRSGFSSRLWRFGSFGSNWDTLFRDNSCYCLGRGSRCSRRNNNLLLVFKFFGSGFLCFLGLVSFLVQLTLFLCHEHLAQLLLLFSRIYLQLGFFFGFLSRCKFNGFWLLFLFTIVVRFTILTFSLLSTN